MNTPIQFLLASLICGLGLLVGLRMNKPSYVRMMLVLFLCTGIWFVIRPEDTTLLAHALGVGRGVDLLIYLGGISGAYFMLILHLRMLRQEELLRRIVREMAIEKALTSSSSLDSSSRRSDDE